MDVDPYDNLDWGWVNIVRCWDHDFDLEGRERGREYVEVEDGDEGWMQIAAHMVGPDFYEVIGSTRLHRIWCIIDTAVTTLSSLRY